LQHPSHLNKNFNTQSPSLHIPINQNNYATSKYFILQDAFLTNQHCHLLPHLLRPDLLHHCLPRSSCLIAMSTRKFILFTHFFQYKVCKDVLTSPLTRRDVPWITTQTNLCKSQDLSNKCMLSTFEAGGITDAYVVDHDCVLLDWYNGIPNAVTASVSSQLRDFVIVDVGIFSKNIQMVCQLYLRSSTL
jgi:hypothetical protein